MTHGFALQCRLHNPTTCNPPQQFSSLRYWRPHRSSSHVCNADPNAMQEAIMGGSVALAASAALLNSVAKEPESCPQCRGTGVRVQCFACEGSGKMTSAPLEQQAAAGSRLDLASKDKSRECRVCKGAGVLFCQKCNGSGYTKTM